MALDEGLMTPSAAKNGSKDSAGEGRSPPVAQTPDSKSIRVAEEAVNTPEARRSLIESHAKAGRETSTGGRPSTSEPARPPRRHTYGGPDAMKAQAAASPDGNTPAGSSEYVVQKEVIAVFQALNKRDFRGRVEPFDTSDVQTMDRIATRIAAVVARLQPDLLFEDAMLSADANQRSFISEFFAPGRASDQSFAAEPARATSLDARATELGAVSPILAETEALMQVGGSYVLPQNSSLSPFTIFMIPIQHDL